MKLTEPETITKTEKELIESIHKAIDGNVIKQLLTEKRLNNPKNRIIYSNGDLVVHDNQIVYQVDFEFRMPVSIVFSRQGECLEINPGREDGAMAEPSSHQKTIEARDRSSEKVELLAASIADMINEINQSEES